MVRTVDLFREYPTTLTTLFNTCFLSSDFEEEFLDRELQNELINTPSITKPRTTRPTITDWIYDAHKAIPNTLNKKSIIKGVYTRMKFYKIKESHDDKQIKLTPVTENQKYWFYNKLRNEYCTDRDIKISDRESIIYIDSLVLPQSSISKEPIFRIEVSMKVYGINNNINKTRIEIKLRVECSVRAWGISSFIEKFLINQAQNTYKHWLKFVNDELIKITINKQKLNENVIYIEDIEDNDGDTMIDDEAIEIDEFMVNQKTVQQQKKVNNILQSMRENVVQKRNNNINKDISPQTHSMDIGIITKGMNNNNNNNNNNIGNHIHDTEIDIINNKNDDFVHESRGLLKKKSVPLRVKICRCVTRICPNIFLREKKSNIHLIVDSRCKYLEKTLWCVIVACCTMIILLTIHRYKTN